MQAFCTIITADHFPKALALFRSIRKFDDSVELHVLVADDHPVAQVPTGMRIFSPEALMEYPLVREVHRKYAHINIDNFRWSMKPLFTAWFLENGYSRIIYADCDMFFVNDYRFLFEELANCGLWLVPHWKTLDPLEDKQAFLSLFTSGIYLAGLFGASTHGLPALKWWAQACHFMMMPAIDLGVHDDQRYLDIVPAVFDNTSIIRHRGVGIGAWNQQSSPRTASGNDIMIAHRYPVIAIHFDREMIEGILKGHDPLLKPYLDEYRQAFHADAHSLDDYFPDSRELENKNIVKTVKWKLKLRTRMKRWLYRAAEKL